MSQVEQQRTARSNPRPFATSFAVAGAIVVFAPMLIVAVFGLPESAEALGRLMGSVFLPAIAAALVAGTAARRSANVWPWWKYLAAVASITLLLVTLARAGQV